MNRAGFLALHVLVLLGLAHLALGGGGCCCCCFFFFLFSLHLKKYSKQNRIGIVEYSFDEDDGDDIGDGMGEIKGGGIVMEEVAEHEVLDCDQPRHLDSNLGATLRESRSATSNSAHTLRNSTSDNKDAKKDANNNDSNNSQSQKKQNQKNANGDMMVDDSAVGRTKILESGMKYSRTTARFFIGMYSLRWETGLGLGFVSAPPFLSLSLSLSLSLTLHCIALLAQALAPTRSMTFAG